jgi:hypothetical protein
MSRQVAKSFYDRGSGEPAVEYITPEDAKHSVDTIYDDMASGAAGRPGRWWWGDDVARVGQPVAGDEFLNTVTYDIYGYDNPTNLTGGP